MEADFKPCNEYPYLFASYSHEDQEAVIPICDTLRRNGYAVVYDKDIPPGVNWLDWVQSRISQCGIVLALVSPKFADSYECKTEIQYARKERKDIIPVYLYDFDPPGWLDICLHGIQRIDYDNPDEVIKQMERNEELSFFRHLEISSSPSFQSPSPNIPDVCSNAVKFTTRETLHVDKLSDVQKSLSSLSIVAIAAYVLAAVAVLTILLMILSYFFGRPAGHVSDDGVLIINKGTAFIGKLRNYDPFSNKRVKKWSWLDQKDDIKKAYIDSGISNVCTDMFKGCANLEEVHILGRITSIGPRAFWGCKSLSKFDIPEGVTSIGAFAFWGCENLSSITIPESVTSIGPGAFTNSGITEDNVTIPDSVEYIGENAFG